MDLFLDPEFLARMQFAATAAFHFLFVPLSVGIGLIMALVVTQAYRTKDPKKEAAARMWVKILAAVFTVGIVSGLAMEFAFGANWADYSRFGGSIFGAPLAAEALLSFFLESIFLGILIFGWNKVSRGFYVVAAWLTWFGSALSALWILIANSWMQTPAGSEVVTENDVPRAVVSDFLAAALNPSLASRYFHVILALLVIASFVAMAIAAYYMSKKKHPEFASSTMKLGAILGAIMTCLLLITAHSSSVGVAEQQPTKFAMMEGMYNDEVPPLYLFGYVDEANQQVVAPFAIPGGTSFLLNGTWDSTSPGLSTLENNDLYAPIADHSMPVNLVFQTYHLMVLMFGLIVILLVLALIFGLGKGRVKEMKWLQKVLMFSPIVPVIAIQTGWMTAEYGRQPWVVYPNAANPDVTLLTSNAWSQVVSAPEIIITIALFAVVYIFLLIVLLKVVFGIIKKGPIEAAESAPKADSSSAKEGA
ncbi:MAG: cytochrome ubiquinol oxidase subunit I [Coriobacteriales bacterium]|jgi:cytochrome d ubiquinol oxidase subunit I|nr:cytochrome ubiquinol oxidase subunit I [Coriobacteriales bacterium]